MSHCLPLMLLMPLKGKEKKRISMEIKTKQKRKFPEAMFLHFSPTLSRREKKVNKCFQRLKRKRRIKTSHAQNFKRMFEMQHASSLYMKYFLFWNKTVSLLYLFHTRPALGITDWNFKSHGTTETAAEHVLIAHILKTTMFVHTNKFLCLQLFRFSDKSFLASMNYATVFSFRWKLVNEMVTRQ